MTISKDAGEDFLVSYSAMASTTSVISQSYSPIDMVLVLDLSPMSNSQPGKAVALLNAVENAISAMMDANPQNRVAVVAYSSQAEILLPLGIYKAVQFSYNGKATQTSTVTCTYSAEGSTSNTETFTIARNTGSGVNKYTQMGIYTGMKILEEVQDTTVVAGDGDTVVRQPVLILLSEGEPKIASTNIASPTQSLIPPGGWSEFNPNQAYTSERDDMTGGVEILRNYGLNDSNTNNNARRAQTFATLLTAAYMKKQVTNHYFNGSSNRQALVYTVGIRTDSANSPGLARIVLDPSSYLVSDANSFSDDFIGYAESYFGTNQSISIIDAGVSSHKTTFQYN